MLTYVVAVDFSKCSRHMLDEALHEAKLAGARVVLVHAFQRGMPFGMTYRDETLDPIRELEREMQLDEAVELTTQWAEPLRKAGLEVECIAKEDAPADLILATAAEHEAARILLGRAGHNAIAEFFVGSTADRVIRSAKVPVLVVPSPKK